MRAFLLVLVAALPALAGCIADDAATAPLPDASVSATPPLAFLPPVDLLCAPEGISQVQDVAFRAECGAFGEPVVEVAGDGAIWASATCCVGRSPPIWVSRDGGASFLLLPFADRTGLVRDAFGIEGDFAIDDAGNVYFFDISAASTWFSKYEADGTHVFTKADTFPPLVDRPWVRAGKADEAWVFYNTGSATNLYHSTNGGLTWTLQPTTFGCALMTIGQGPARDRLFVSGCTDDPALWVSDDGGASFGSRVDLPVPTLKLDQDTGNQADPIMPPVADAAGNIYVPFTWATNANATHVAVFVDVVHPDGTIVGPIQVSDDLALQNLKPWGAAGAQGRFAVSWYAADKPTDDADEATWTLQVAATMDGASAAPTFVRQQADPDPVLKGQFGRALGDFLQADVGPDGRYVTIYAKRDEAGQLTNRVVITDGVDLGAGVPTNGPQA